MKYIINEWLRIETAADGTLPLTDVNLLIAVLAGSSFHGFRQEDGCPVLSQPTGGQWFIPYEGMTQEQRDQDEMPSYYPALDNQFMQALMMKYPMTINPVVSRNSYLLGHWRVESLSLLTSATSKADFRSGLITGLNEPVITENNLLYLSIAQNAFMQAGLGKKAVFYYGEEEKDPVVLFVNENSLSILREDQFTSAHTVEVPALDKYAFVPGQIVLDANYKEIMAVAWDRLIVQKSDL